MFKLTSREKKFLIILLLLVFCVLMQKIFQKSVLFVYNHPDTNIATFSHIAPAIKKLDVVLDKSSQYMGSAKYRVSYVYRNYYGSGFLKENVIPNDLDAMIGVFLGEYNYDGTNSDIIQKAVMSKISVFHTAFLEVLHNYASTEMVSLDSLFESFNDQALYSETNRAMFEIALNKAFNKQPYLVMNEKTALDDKSVKAKIPYYMESNEILIENKKPFVLYSNLIKYNSLMNKYMREFSVIFDFFIDVKNTKTGEVIRMQLVPEAFLGERLQYSRRMFVPNTFVGLDSYKYLKDNKLLNDANSYLDKRLYNSIRYIQIFEYGLDKDLLYVKMLKRLHQAVDGFAPLLTGEEKKNYYSVIGDYLNNEYVANINDISNIVSVLGSIVTTQQCFEYFKLNGQINELSYYFDKNLQNLKKSQMFDDTLLTETEKIKNSIIEKMLGNEYEYIDIYNFVQYQKVSLYKNIKDLYPAIIDKQELIKIEENLKQRFVKAGYKKVKVYWLDENNIGVLSCPEINKISEHDFRIQAVASGFPDVNYRFIKKKDLGTKVYVESTLWIRLNPTVQENAYFEDMKKRFLKDKENYKIKTKFILK